MLFAKEQLPEQVVDHSMRLWYYAVSRLIEKMGKWPQAKVATTSSLLTE
jgi:hypothetical protein